MRKVLKFKIETKDVNKIEVPLDAKFLSAQCQKGQICVWALCENTTLKELRIVEIFGTGHDIPDDENLIFIDTVQLLDGDIVLHVFERRFP
jgi:hypothetical protein